MNQVTYNQTCDKVNRLQTLLIFTEDIIRNNCQKKLNKINKLLDDEYRYGSSNCDLKHIFKYINDLDIILSKNV